MTTVVGANMKRLRKERGWTQARVAREMLRAAGITDSEPVTEREVYRYERGLRSPVEWLPIIADVFGVTEEELIRPPLRADEDTDDYATEIRALSRRLVALDNEMSGLPVADAAAVAFRRVHQRLGEGDHGRDAQAAAAELAEVAGWALWNEAKPAAARRFNQESLFLAQLSGDRSTELITLQNIGLLAGWSGRPGEELAIARSVLERDRLTPRVEAMFRSREAQGLAMTGQLPEADQSFGKARSLLSDGGSENDPAWSWWVTGREVDRQHGRVLQLTGQYREAIPVLQRAMIADGTHVGYRNIAAIRLLACLLKVQAWQEALEEVEKLTPAVSGMNSVISLSILSKLAAVHKLDAGAPESLRDALDHIQREISRDPYMLP